jgi:nucleolar protein 6
MGPPKNHQDATRAERKAKKRKLEDAIPDLPGEEGEDVEIGEGKVDGEKKIKKRKKSGEVVDGESKEERSARKKEKREKKEEAVETEPNFEESKVDEPAVEGPKKSKKERKAERKAKEAAEASKLSVEVPATSNGAATSAEGKAGEKEGDKSKKNNRNREKKRKGANNTPIGGEEEKSKTPAKFIVFIGTSTLSQSIRTIPPSFSLTYYIQAISPSQQPKPQYPHTSPP